VAVSKSGTSAETADQLYAFATGRAADVGFHNLAFGFLTHVTMSVNDSLVAHVLTFSSLNTGATDVGVEVPYGPLYTERYEQ
jgi:hypothetical protein